MAPDLVAPMAAFLAHEDCPVSGEIYVAGAGRFARLFLAITEGYVDSDGGRRSRTSPPTGRRSTTRPATPSPPTSGPGRGPSRSTSADDDAARPRAGARCSPITPAVAPTTRPRSSRVESPRTARWPTELPRTGGRPRRRWRRGGRRRRAAFLQLPRDPRDDLRRQPPRRHRHADQLAAGRARGALHPRALAGARPSCATRRCSTSADEAADGHRQPDC